MRTPLLILIALFLVRINLYSQDYRVEFGLNISTVNASFSKSDSRNSFNIKYDERTSINLGLSKSFFLTQTLSIDAGVLFSGKGYQMSEEQVMSGSRSKIEYKTSIFYTDIPVRLKLSTSRANKIRIFATSGPYFGIGLFGKIKQEHNEEIQSSKINFGKDIESFDFGISNGFGFGTDLIQFVFYYDLGLIDVSPSSIDSKHKIFRFSTSIKIN